MLKYLKEFREHKNIIVQTKKQDYRVTKLYANRFHDGKEEIHIRIKGSFMSPDKEDILGVIGLYNFKLRRNRMRSKFDSLIGKGKTLSVYVIFTSLDDRLVITLKPLPSNIITVEDLLNEVALQYKGTVELNGHLINPKLTDNIKNDSDLSFEELTNQIKITGY